MSKYTDTIPNACEDGKAWAIKNKIKTDSEAWKKPKRTSCCR